MAKDKEFQSKAVKEKFDSYPKEIRPKMLSLRQLIFAVAARTPGVGPLEETLKWGEPSYLTPSQSGSTVRIDWKKSMPSQYAVYFNCKTSLVQTFGEMFGDTFSYGGQRSILFEKSANIPMQELAVFISIALTYRLHKKHQKF